MWESSYSMLSDDIERKKRRAFNHPTLVLQEDVKRSYTLIEIDNILMRYGKSLKDIKEMPLPSFDDLKGVENKLVREEQMYDHEQLHQEWSEKVQQLNTEQLHVYEEVIDAVYRNKGGVMFLYGHGGTGKTFLYSTLSAKSRADNKIVLNVASSGIAALLLPGGRTAHGRFEIPIELFENSTCNISRRSQLAELIRMTSLIIWDEAPMDNRFAYEALDRTMRDRMAYDDPEAEDKVFGGKVVLLGGDFHQVLPIINKGSRQDIGQASVSGSYIWKECKIYTLKRSMRVSERQGERQRYGDEGYLRERAILTPLNEIADYIHSYMTGLLPGEEVTYRSCDEICSSSTECEDHFTSYPTEYLNSLVLQGLPRHELKLKIGMPIILLRNISPARGLCNGTRLIISRLGKFIVEGKIITGSNVGQTVIIPRIVMTTSDTKIPFILKRRQYPLRPCYAMTINKSQAQSLDYVGVYLPKPVFSHGQLYVAASRTKSPEGLRFYIDERDQMYQGHTRNIVYKEVFTNLPN
ncbi:uncharacterized protein LOC141631809 [Silene latifolia]|uniref:uncharacterized protein LOC141631809 n=1 Tax=Silene latifolia TaxID=37657 RepID=UPI003D780313